MSEGARDEESEREKERKREKTHTCAKILFTIFYKTKLRTVDGGILIGTRTIIDRY